MSLFCALFPQNNERPVPQLVRYMIDIAMGMHYISERGLVHRVSDGSCLL